MARNSSCFLTGRVRLPEASAIGEIPMYMIEILIPEHRLPSLERALNKCSLVAMTVTPVSTIGLAEGGCNRLSLRGAIRQDVRSWKVEVAVEADDVQCVLNGLYARMALKIPSELRIYGVGDSEELIPDAFQAAVRPVGGRVTREAGFRSFDPATYVN